MDGVGRAYDNFLERLWRSPKYEEVYLRDYAMIPEARRGIGEGLSSAIIAGRTRHGTSSPSVAICWFTSLSL